MIETVSSHTKPMTAFAKGMRELAAVDRRKAAKVRDEIREALGVKRTQYFERQRGEVRLSPAEEEKIGRIFRRCKITDPWGV